MQLAQAVVARVADSRCRDVLHDLTKPDGAPRKLLNVDRLRGMGWRPRTSLEDGLRSTYDWFRSNVVPVA